MYFPIYEIVKSRLKKEMGWKEKQVRLYSLSAGISGAACNIITNPLWVVRTRMQSEILKNPSEDHFKRKYNHGPLSVAKNLNDIFRNEGFKALYKGLSATMVGIIHPIIFFPAYENLKILLKNKYEPQNDGKLSNSLIAASTIIAKVSASLISYPHEVLRSRLQFNQRLNISLISLIRQMIKNEGFLSLYSGFTANIFRIIPNYAIIFIIYENLCDL